MSEAQTRARKRCREIMTRQPKTLASSAELREAAAAMRDGDVGSIPIVDDGRLVGIATDRDIVVRALADGKGPETAVGEVMTTEIFSVRPEDHVFEAIRLMGDKQIRRLPVVDDEGRLQGIIAMADIALETEDEREVAEALEEISSGAAFWNKK